MKERFKGGIPVDHVQISKEAVRKTAENAVDWQYQEMARTLYRWADIFKERLLDPIALLGRDKMPDPVLSFRPMDHRIPATYTLHRNAQGLLDEITMNTKRLDRPLWSILETLLHEQVHLWQQNFGRHPVQRNYHNREFVSKCEQFGLHPRIRTGAHWKPADGPFEQLMKEHGIEKPSSDVVPEPQEGNWWDLRKKERKGKSTLAKWSCGCTNVRVGVKDLQAVCLKCGNRFASVDNEAGHVVHNVWFSPAREQ